jgi:leucyl aminopeptidase
MKITLSLSPAAQVETECLVAVVLDRADNSDKSKPGRPKNDQAEAFVSASDKAVQQAAADLLSSGDVAGKIFEVSWLHKPAGLKAKRLLLVGGGKAKNFSATELRKLAGAAVRALKPRNLHSLAFVVPEKIDGEGAVKAIVEGALAGNFDPDTYKSDRKDQTVESLTVVAPGNQKALQQAGTGADRQGHHFRYRRHFHQTRRWHGKNEIRYGRRRDHDRHHARDRAT